MHEPCEPRGGGRDGCRARLASIAYHCGVQVAPLFSRQPDTLPHPVDEVVRSLWRPPRRQALSLALVFRDDVAVDTRAYPRIPRGVADQAVAELAWAALVGRVVRVHEGVDLPKSQLTCERAGRGSGAFVPTDQAVGQFVEPGAQSAQVEFVDQAGAPCFEQDRKIARVGDRCEQVLGGATRHPQGLAAIEAPGCEQQRPPGAFAKPGAEKRGGLQRRSQPAIHARAVDEGQKARAVDILLGLEHDRVVVHVYLRRRPPTICPGRAHGQRERPVHAAAPQRVQRDLPFAIRTEEAVRTGGDVFDQEVMAMRQAAQGAVPLPLEIIAELLRGRPVEGELAGQRVAQLCGAVARGELPIESLSEAANAQRQVVAAIDALGLPERRRAA